MYAGCSLTLSSGKKNVSASEVRKLPSVPAMISGTRQCGEWPFRTLAGTAFG